MARARFRAARLGVAALTALGLGGCEDPSPAAPPPPDTSRTAVASVSASSVPAAKARALFSFSFNGTRARNVLVLEGVPRPLAEVATASAQDVRRWHEIVVTPTSGSPITIPYRERFGDDHQARVYLDRQHRVRLGFFADGGEDPVREVVDVRAIDLLFEEPTTRPLEITFGGDVRTIDRSALEGLRPIRKGLAGNKDGVRLLDVMRAVEGMITIGRVTVEGRQRKTFCVAEIDGSSQEVLLRENKRGELMVDVWRPSDDAKPSARIRELERLVVSAEPCGADGGR